MANKRINDLQARSSFDATCNVAVDDASQTWRATGAQMLTYFAANVAALASWITGQTADADPASGDHVLTYDLSALALKKVTLANMWKDRVRAVTTTDTATAEDDTLLLSAAGGGFTQSLPTAVGIKGKCYSFVLTNATGIVTLDPAGTETIGSSTTLKMGTVGDNIQIISDGANWQVIAKDISVVAMFGNTSTLAVTTSTIIWPVETLDSHGAYDPATGEFTVPPGEGGIYELTASGINPTGAGATAMGARVNGGTIDYFQTYNGSGLVNSGGTKFNCVPGDVITTIQSGGGVSQAAGCRLCIQKIPR